jgi:hypothetical protein
MTKILPVLERSKKDPMVTRETCTRTSRDRDHFDSSVRIYLGALTTT